MSWSFKTEGLGAITYSSLAIYILFIIGVLLTCHQKLKRRGSNKDGKQDESAKKNKKNKKLTQINKEELNGVRKRSKKNEELNSSSENSTMGLFQSKSKSSIKNVEDINDSVLNETVVTTLNESSLLSEIHAKLTVSEKEVLENFVTTARDTTTINILSPQDQQLQNGPGLEDCINDVVNSKLLSHTSEGNNEIIDVTANKSIDQLVTLSSILKSSNAINNTSYVETSQNADLTNYNLNEYYQEINDITESKNAFKSLVSLSESKTSHSDDTVVTTNMPSTKCSTQPEDLEPQVLDGYVQAIEYITVEETTVSEEYEDGTTVVSTTVTEISESRPIKSPKEEVKDKILHENKNIEKPIVSSPEKILPPREDDNIENPEGELEKFASEFSMSIMQSAFDNFETDIISEHTNLERTDLEKYVKIQPKRLTNFKLFIFHKYAEKIIGSIMSIALNESISEIKQNGVSNEYVSSLAPDIINDVINESVQVKKQNEINLRISEGPAISKIADALADDILSRTFTGIQLFTKNQASMRSFADNLADSLLHDSMTYDTLMNDNLAQEKILFEIDAKQNKIDTSLDIKEENIQNVSEDTSKNILNLTYNHINKISGDKESAASKFLVNGHHKITLDEEKCLQNGDTLYGEILDEKEPCMQITLNNALNKEMNLTIVDGEIKVTTDANQNVISNGIDSSPSFLRLKKGQATDRPLSGFAEKLAELLEEEDELDFLDSDEELSESLEKIKETFGQKRRISMEINNLQQKYSIDELNDYGGKNLKTKVTVKRRDKKNNRLKGDRPISLYAQDMLDDLLNDDTKEFEDFEDEEDEDDEDVVVDEILPVKATAEILEDLIPMAPQSRNFSTSSEFDVALDEAVRGHGLESQTPGQDKPPCLRKAAVIDTGCGILKAGLCGEVKPSCYCPSVIGVPRRFSQDMSKMKKAYYVGDEAWAMAGMLQIEHPLKQNISDWPDVSNVIEHLLEYELKINDNEHPIMLTEMGLTSNKHREKLTEIMFERFGVPSFYLANQGSLAMYSMGLTSGICLNSGFYNTQAISVYEGHSVPHGTVQLDIGGDHVTNYLGRMLMANQGLTFISSSEKLVLNSMKQSLCYVAEDANREQELYKTNMNMHQMYTLPDGQEIEVGSERCLATEILFDPQMLGLHQPNTAEIVQKSIQLMDIELHPILSQNILVTGGNSKLSGYGDRLETELTRLYGSEQDCKIRYADDPISTWIGGSILSSISGFRDQWITLDQYAELGSKSVRMYCF